MSGLLGFLLASGVFALIGTALRGLIRPISWSLFAIATLLAASQQLLTEAQNEAVTDPLRSNIEISDVNGTSNIDTLRDDIPNDDTLDDNTSVAPVPTASVNLPVAVAGWQSLPFQLEPAVNQVLDAALPNPAPEITIATDPSPAPTNRASETTDPPATSTRSTTSSTPIQGFW